MQKIVINSCYGGFGLSHEAMLEYAKRKDITVYPEKHNFGFYTYWLQPKPIRNENSNTLSDGDIKRDDPILVSIVEEMGSKKASGEFAQLKIVEIPDDVEWEIEQYDGNEWISEVHETWS